MGHAVHRPHVKELMPTTAGAFSRRACRESACACAQGAMCAQACIHPACVCVRESVCVCVCVCVSYRGAVTDQQVRNLVRAARSHVFDMSGDGLVYLVATMAKQVRDETHTRAHNDRRMHTSRLVRTHTGTDPPR